MANGFYLVVIIALYTIAIEGCVFIAIIQQPASLVGKLETHAEFLFTYKGRLIIDVFVSLFLFGMGPFGITMAIITLVEIIGIRLLGSTFPQAFDEIFRNDGGGGGNSEFSSPYGASDGNSFPPPTGQSGFSAPGPSADL